MKFLAPIFLVMFYSLSGFAQTGAKSKRLLFEVNTLFGWGASQIATDTSPPAIGSFDLGLVAGVNIKKISLGLSYDYRILTQFTDVEPLVGNRRGTFVSPVSVLFRLNFEKIKFGFLLVNSGTYELTNKTAVGQKLVYTKPSGFRFDIIFKKFGKITPVLFYESVAFSGMQLDGLDAPLSSNLNYSNYGAGIKYEF